jgi:hypothetical protein
MSDHQSTVHGLKPLIERAIMEYTETLVEDPLVREIFYMRARALSDHISKTIIGESFELELVRKMRPMIREHGALMRLVGYVAKDFQFLEEDDHNAEALQNLRASDPKSPPEKE